MDKEAVVHIYKWNITQLWKKECIWVSSNEVDEARACYKSEVRKRKTSIMY